MSMAAGLVEASSARRHHVTTHALQLQMRPKPPLVVNHARYEARRDIGLEPDGSKKKFGLGLPSLQRIVSD